MVQSFLIFEADITDVEDYEFNHYVEKDIHYHRTGFDRVF